MTRLTAVAQRNALLTLGITFVFGVVVGLVVLGWWLWPLGWTGCPPADLQDSWRQTYLSLVADSYAVTGDAVVARGRVDALVTAKRPLSTIAQELATVAQTRDAGNDGAGAARLRALAVVLAVPPSQTVPAPGTPDLPAAPRPAAPLLSRFLRVCGWFILALVLLAGLLLLVYFLQSRTSAEPAEEAPAPPAKAAVAPEPRPAVISPPPAPVQAPQPGEAPPPPAPAPLGPFIATYNLGDIDFDMSFGIESASGDFLGECGLGMAETIGAGEVQHVTAFEVWLFDKTDIRTVSVVLASAHAHADAATRTKLASRGDIVMAQPGGVFAIKTSSLKLEGHIVDMAYGTGDAPAQSYFTTFSVELKPVQLTGGQEG